MLSLMMELDFKLRPVYKKPSIVYRSKYDDIINEFIGCSDTIAEIRYDHISPYSVRIQLSNRIEKRELNHKLKTYVKNGIVYLEKQMNTRYKFYITT